MGMRKRLRMAAKTNHALETGFYYVAPDLMGRERHPTPVSAGVLRAKARLDAHSNAQAERLKDAVPALVSRPQARAAARAAEKKATRLGPNTSRKRVRPAAAISPASAGKTTSAFHGNP